MFHKVTESLQNYDSELFCCICFYFLPIYPSCAMSIEILLLYALMTITNTNLSFFRNTTGEELTSHPS